MLFRDPLKPCLPADDQDTAPPCVSVIVMIVLLKVDLMWATPFSTTRFSLLLTLSFLLAKAYPASPASFLASDSNSLLGAFSGTGIGLSPLPSDRESPSMPKASISPKIDKALYVQLNFSS